MKKIIIVSLLSLFIHDGFSQTIWKADIPVVEKSGYYNIEITQELIGAGLQYLKILDEQDVETPYFIRSANPIQEINNFEDYVLKSNIAKDSLNILIVDNQNTENLSRFCLVMQQADAQIYASVRGGNDLKQWYIVKQQTAIVNPRHYSSANTEMLILDIPQGNYRYYEITLQNNQSSPLEIHKVGKIKNSNVYGNFVEIDFGVFTQENNPTDKETLLRFPQMQHPYCINKIEWDIKNKSDYYREAYLLDTVSYRNRVQFSLSSRKNNSLLLDDFLFDSHTLIRIQNQNNPPLLIDSIRVYGLCRYACVYLEAGKKYAVHSNNKDHTDTTYDIEHFRDKIPVDLPILQTTNQENHIILDKPAPQRELSLIEQPVFMWSVIIIIGILLLFICVRMIKEMKKK